MAYNGDAKKAVSSSFLFTTLQSFYTKIKGLLDTKADKTALNSINPNTIASGYTKNPFYINTHPENSGAIIPFINNDIAYLLKRGGSAVVYYDGVVQSTDISNVFDGSASYWNISVSDVTEVIIELTLHKTFTYTNVAYIDFGATHWRAKNIMIDVMNSNSETEWTNKSTITENQIGEHKITFTHNDGTGFNKIRFTFSNFAYTSFRLACLGLLGYNSNGLRETFLPKDGGSVYGSITPFNTSTYNLGSSSLKWNDVYATKFNGDLNGAATTLSGLTATVAELNYCDGVTSNIQTQLNGKSSSSHTHDQYYDANQARSANTVLAAPNGSDGGATFRKLVAADLPNHTHSYLPLSGGTVTGTVTIQSSALNGTYNGLLVGDDCYIGDCNIANTIGLMGATNNNIAYIKFGKSGGSLGYDGTNLVYNNAKVYTSSNITYGTSALTAGSSSLATGNIYLQYE